MNNDKNKRVLVGAKIKETSLNAAEAAAAATGLKKGSVIRVILEDVLNNFTHEELKALIYREKSLKIE